LLFVTPQWRRLVPTSWAVFPNALSVLIQYLSLRWPTENGWVAYNGLQLIAYFITVFIAAPAALITGSACRPRCRLASNESASAQHPGGAIGCTSCALLVLVLHRDPRHARIHDGPAAEPEPHLRVARQPTAGSAFGSCAASMVVVIVAWVAPPCRSASPPAGHPASRFRLDRPAQRLFEHLDATPGRVQRKGHLTLFLAQRASIPTQTEYRALLADNFVD